MDHGFESLSDRVDRLENTVSGGENGGMMGRMMKIESELAHMNRSLDSISTNLSRAVWIVLTAVIVAILGMVLMRPGQSEGARNSTSVQVGGVGDKQGVNQAPELRGYYLTSEVAKLINVSERTVQAMCQAGKIQGATQPKDGRGWRIPLTIDTRGLSGNLPQVAADSGKQPQTDDCHD